MSMTDDERMQEWRDRVKIASVALEGDDPGRIEASQQEMRRWLAGADPEAPDRRDDATGAAETPADLAEACQTERGNADGIARIARRIERACKPGAQAPDRYLEAARAAAEANSAEQALSAMEAALWAGLPEARPAGEVEDPIPAPLLSATAQGGAGMTPGAVTSLAGEGGIAKSTLALSIGLGVAALDDGKPGDVSGGLFQGVGGPVVVVGYEDAPGWTAMKIKTLAAMRNADKGLERVHLMHMHGWPIFGPMDEGGRRGFYNQRPGRLDGWRALERACERVRPRLIIIDPAMAAYVGEPNAAAPVREFYGALETLAEQFEAGCLMLAHTTKAARVRGNAQDPFDAGQTSGSGQWTDAARAALTLTWGENPGDRVLGVAKSNYGPDRILVDLETLRRKDGTIIGFNAAGNWRTQEEEEEREDDGPKRNQAPKKTARSRAAKNPARTAAEKTNRRNNRRIVTRENNEGIGLEDA